jgi:hypothetical protein
MRNKNAFKRSAGNSGPRLPAARQSWPAANVESYPS